jgi:hypothetical protein
MRPRNTISTAIRECSESAWRPQSVHAAVVFLAAIIIGLVMGGLMFLHDQSVPAAVAADLLAAGFSVPVLHI